MDLPLSLSFPYCDYADLIELCKQFLDKRHEIDDKIRNLPNPRLVKCTDEEILNEGIAILLPLVDIIPNIIDECDETINACVHSNDTQLLETLKPEFARLFYEYMEYYNHYIKENTNDKNMLYSYSWKIICIASIVFRHITDILEEKIKTYKD